MVCALFRLLDSEGNDVGPNVSSVCYIASKVARVVSTATADVWSAFRRKSRIFRTSSRHPTRWDRSGSFWDCLDALID